MLLRSFTTDRNMLCEWVDPPFVRYALLIIFVSASMADFISLIWCAQIHALSFSTLSAVILICTIVHFFTIFDHKATKKPRCMNTLYICAMFACTGALLVFSNILVNRLAFQTQRVDRVLSKDSMMGKRMLWDVLQRSYECCGRRNATDYWTRLPESCCSQVAPPLRMSFGYLSKELRATDNLVYIANECTVRHAHPMGCVDALSAYMRSVSRYLSLAAFTFGCVAMMGCFVSCATAYGFIGGAKSPNVRQRGSVSTA